MPTCQNNHEVAPTDPRCGICNSPNPGYAAGLVRTHRRYEGAAGGIPRIVAGPERAKPRVDPDRLALDVARGKLNVLIAKIERMKASLEDEYQPTLDNFADVARRCLALRDASKVEEAAARIEGRFVDLLKSVKQARATSSTDADPRPVPAKSAQELQEEVMALVEQLSALQSADASGIFADLKAALQTLDPDQQLEQFEALQARAAQAVVDAPKEKELADAVVGQLVVLHKFKSSPFPPRILAVLDGLDQSLRQGMLPSAQGRTFAEREQKLKQMAREAQTKIALAMNCVDQLLAYPQDTRVLLAQFEQARSIEEAQALVTAWSERAQKDKDKAEVAAELVDALGPERLRNKKALPIGERIAMIGELRRGDPATRTKRREAIAALYHATELDETFLKQDEQQRKAVLKELKTEFLEARKNWIKLGDEQKMAMIGKALEIQCRAMGITPPEVHKFSEPESTMSAEKKVGCNGYHQNGKIFINDETTAFGKDFDSILDTVIHENTHNYQRILVERLSADTRPPRIEKGDPHYDQVVLFALNSGDGHFEGTEPDGGIVVDGKPVPDAGYMGSPVERHAWLAGGEAGRLFLNDAKIDALFLLDTMETWADTHAKGDRTIAQWCKALDERRADAKSTAGQITEDVNYYEEKFEAYRLAFEDRQQDRELEAARQELAAVKQQIFQLDLSAMDASNVSDIRQWKGQSSGYAFDVDGRFSADDLRQFVDKGRRYLQARQQAHKDSI